MTKIRRRKELWKEGEQLGFVPADVVGILRVNGFVGEFVPALFDQYVAVIRRHRQLLDGFTQRIEETPVPIHFSSCPICGAEVYYVDGHLPDADRWRCKVVTGHWGQWKWASVKAWMTRNSRPVENWEI